MTRRPNISLVAETSAEERRAFAAGLAVASIRLQAEANEARAHDALKIAEWIEGVAADLLTQAERVVAATEPKP